MTALLAEVSIRATLAAIAVGASVWACRVKSPRARHVAWAFVLIAMLSLPVTSGWLPTIPVPLLPPEQTYSMSTSVPLFEEVTPQAADLKGSISTIEPMRWDGPVDWLSIIWAGIAALLLCRLVLATLATRRIKAVAAPITVGWLRARILLPASAANWPPEKLEAVLAHESEHAKWRDPLVQWVAQLNCCVFWFHPLSWWLVRQLSALSEEACDQAALDRGHQANSYCRYLLEIAQEMQFAGGRIIASSMGACSLEGRVQAILTGRRSPLSPLRRLTCSGLCALSLSAFCACNLERREKPAAGQPSMRQLAQQRTEERQSQDAKRKAFEEAAAQMTPTQTDALEQTLSANPTDLEARRRLMTRYRQLRDASSYGRHVLWLVGNAPDSDLLQGAGSIHPAWNPAWYRDAQKLWNRSLSAGNLSAPAYRSAATFFGDDKERAEQILLEGQRKYPSDSAWTGQLGHLYAQILLGVEGPLGMYGVPYKASDRAAESPLAQRVHRKLQASSDPKLLTSTAHWMWSWGQNPQRDRKLPLAKEYVARAMSLDPEFEPARRLSVYIQKLKRVEMQRVLSGPASASERLKALHTNLQLLWMQGKEKEAEQAARELLDVAAQHRSDPEYGTAIFYANETLSKIALRGGNVRQSVKHLLAATEAPATEQLRFDYINMSLPRALVDRGEREAVAQFLERCGRFNFRGKQLAQWASQIRGGINPDLTPTVSCGKEPC